MGSRHSSKLPGCLGICSFFGLLFVLYTPFLMSVGVILVSDSGESSRTSLSTGVLVSSYSSNRVYGWNSISWSSFQLTYSELDDGSQGLPCASGSGVSSDSNTTLAWSEFFCDGDTYTEPAELGVLRGTVIAAIVLLAFASLMSCLSARRVLRFLSAVIFTSAFGCLVAALATVGSWDYFAQLRAGTAGVLVPLNSSTAFTLVNSTSGLYMSNGYWMLVLSSILSLSASLVSGFCQPDSEAPEEVAEDEVYSHGVTEAPRASGRHHGKVHVDDSVSESMPQYPNALSHV